MHDRLLLEAFHEHRDESSFRALYGRHTPLLFGVAVRLCGSRQEAEELTQEAWIRAVERHDRFDWRSKYSTWLTGILVNCFRERARQLRRQTLAFADNERDESMARSAPSAETMDIERALRSLSEGYREVVVLHDLHGYTHAEIAVMLEIKEGTSKSQLQRGRARLRALMQGDTQYDQPSTSEHYSDT